MRPAIKYITQITAEELREVAAAANTHGGDLVIVNRQEDGLEISVDMQQLRDFVQRVIREG